MRKQLIPFLAASLAAACFLTNTNRAQAAPTFDFDPTGTNKLTIAALTATLGAADIHVSKFGGTKVAGSSYSFSIIGGAVDAGTIALEAVSAGGLELTSGTDVLILSPPIVNTTGSQPIMTFLVTINGKLEGRYAVFELKVPSYAKPQDLAPGEPFVAGNIVATLSSAGADVLNSAFSTSFAAGQAAGTVKVRSVIGGKLPG